MIGSLRVQRQGTLADGLQFDVNAFDALSRALADRPIGVEATLEAVARPYPEGAAGFPTIQAGSVVAMPVPSSPIPWVAAALALAPGPAAPADGPWP